MKILLPIGFAVAALAVGASGILADYTLELKNGRRITVPSYREDGDTIKFPALGGEIGLSKDQIESIRQTVTTDSGNLNFQQFDSIGAPAARSPSKPAEPETRREKPSTQEEERAKEERQYQDKLRALTEQLKSARDQYSESIRGTNSSEPTLLQTDAQIRARNDDISSRFKDAQRNPSPPAPVKLLVPSPFSSLPPQVETLAGQPPPDLGRAQAQTDSEKALSDMRNRVNQLEQERERLINEMRQKNLKTGSLFLE